MLTLEQFLTLPTEEIATLVRAAGHKVCVFPVNGTRRWFMLEHADKIQDDFISAYVETIVPSHVRLCKLLFDHGIETILSPVFGRELMRRGDDYTRRVGIDGLARIATDKNYLDFFETYRVKVRFYGDYEQVLAGTSYQYAVDAMQQVTEATSNNSKFRLFFGVFADEADESTARMAVEHYQAEGTIPDKAALVRKYYGEDIPPVSLFIGFDKFSVFDMPLLATGEEDLYFSISPSPYMTMHQLRAILYDHLYLRRAPEPDYTKLPPDALVWMRDYYRQNRDSALGVGTMKYDLWFPHGTTEQ